MVFFEVSSVIIRIWFGCLVMITSFVSAQDSIKVIYELQQSQDYEAVLDGLIQNSKITHSQEEFIRRRVRELEVRQREASNEDISDVCLFQYIGPRENIKLIIGDEEKTFFPSDFRDTLIHTDDLYQEASVLHVGTYARKDTKTSIKIFWPGRGLYAKGVVDLNYPYVLLRGNFDISMIAEISLKKLDSLRPPKPTQNLTTLNHILMIEQYFYRY